MKQLIQITEHKGQKLVNGRELHEFLGVNSRYNDWIKNRIEKYGFNENQDYVSFTKNLVKHQSGRPSTEYGLTLDMAKEICMVENNDKGRQARRYFITIEKKFKEIPQNYSEALRLAANQAETLERQQKQIQSLAPKAELLDKVLDTDEKIDIGQAAKILELPFGRNTLFKELRAKGVFFKNRNEPKQTYVNQGYFQLKEKYIERNQHNGFIVMKVLVTQRGLEYLSKLFNATPNKDMALIQ